MSRQENNTLGKRCAASSMDVSRSAIQTARDGFDIFADPEQILFRQVISGYL
jgi:hypothetical protein